MDKLSDLLGHKSFSEPPEITIIKGFVLKKYGEIVSVKIDLNKIIIYANNSSLAGSLRMDIPAIQNACSTDKRIAIYIG